VDTTKRFSHISLCAGYGGIDLGLSRVIKGLRTVAYCEIELYAIENLVSKMDKGMLELAPIWTNLKTFPFHKFRGQLDILSGGFPCQPFSGAGGREADSDPRHLFPFIKEGILAARPAFVFLENVRGIATSNLKGDGWTDPKGTPILLHICREMERIGYQCEWGFFSAREVGLPHNRDRVIIMGKRNDITHSQLKEFTKHFKETLSGEQHRLPTNQEIHIQDISEANFGIKDIKSNSICTPSFRNAKQHSYEPPRTLLFSRDDRTKVLENTNSERQERYVHTECAGLCVCEWGNTRQTGSEIGSTGQGMENTTTQCDIEQSNQVIEHKVGGNDNGCANRLDYERLQQSFTNLYDEMRLLGNGVVPATMEKAFRVLFDRFLNKI